MIFKIIDDSINGNKKTLALFNKDFNTYKANWANASGGFGNKISTLFSSNDVNCLKEYNNQIQSGIRPVEAYKNNMVGCTTEARKNAVAIAKGSMTYEQATTSMKSMNIASKAASVGLKALSVAGNMALFFAISEGISLAVKGLDKLINKEKYEAEALEKMAQKADEAKSNIDSLTSEMQNNAKVVGDTAERYAELAQGVDKLTGKNLNLSTSDYEEFLDLSNQLSDVFPQLTKGYDDNGNAILGLGKCFYHISLSSRINRVRS